VTTARPITPEQHKTLERVCANVGCYNRTYRGYILCPGCLYEFPQRADDVAVRLKKRLEKAGLLT
jgi:hypothetical protein